jgi:hypothetical protein
MQFWFVTVVPKYFNYTTFSKDMLPLYNNSDEQCKNFCHPEMVENLKKKNPLFTFSAPNDLPNNIL